MGRAPAQSPSRGSVLPVSLQTYCGVDFPLRAEVGTTGLRLLRKGSPKEVWQGGGRRDRAAWGAMLELTEDSSVSTENRPLLPALCWGEP